MRKLNHWECGYCFQTVTLHVTPTQPPICSHGASQSRKPDEMKRVSARAVKARRGRG